MSASPNTFTVMVDNPQLKSLKKEFEESSINNEKNNGNAFITAAQEGEYETLVKLHEGGASLSLLDNQGLTAHWWAACRNRWYTFNYLLKHSTEILNVKPKAGEYAGATLLWLAARARKWVEVENLLLKFGHRDLDTTIEEGEHAQYRILDFAILSENLHIIKLLIRLGATLNLNRALTPLMMANFSEPVFRYLMQNAKAFVDTPLPNHLEVYDENIKVKCMRSAAVRLFEMIRENLLTAASLNNLLKQGAHFNQRSMQQCNTPLHMAIALQKYSAFRIILQSMQSTVYYPSLPLFLSATNADNDTPLDLALKTEQADPKSKAEFSFLITNVIESIIDQQVFQLFEKLAVLKMHRLPLVIIQRIYETQEILCFANHPGRKAYIKEAYRKAFVKHYIKFQKKPKTSKATVHNENRIDTKEKENNNPQTSTKSCSKHKKLIFSNVAPLKETTNKHLTQNNPKQAHLSTPKQKHFSTK